MISQVAISDDFGLIPFFFQNVVLDFYFSIFCWFVLHLKIFENNDFILGWVFGCRLDHSFHGIFQRQFGKFTENELEMAQYEKVVLSSSSSNIWGDCYENFETNSYIFGLK